MNDNEKTREQLLEEVRLLRARLADVEQSRPANVARVDPESQRTREALRASEELNWRIIEAVPGGVVQVARDGSIVKANAAAWRLIGLTPEGKPHRWVNDYEPFTIWEDGSPCAAADYPVIKCLQTGQPQPPSTIGVRQKDGQVSWAIFSAIPLIDEATGQTTGAVVTFVDITERKRAQEALQERETRLRLLLEQMPGVLWTTDLELRVTSAMGAGLALLNKKPNQDVGLSLYEIFQSRDPSLMPIAAHLRVLQGESVFYEWEFLGRWFQTHAEPLRTVNGVIQGCVGVAVDFTERKHAEEALRLAHRKYESLIHAIDGIVWEGDSRTLQFTFVSKQAERLLGYPVEQWLNDPNFWVEKVHPDDRDWAVDFCKTATAAKQPHDFEYRMRAADGRYVWLHDMVTVVVEDDQPVHSRGVMLDITLRKQAEEQARVYSQRLQGLSRRLLEVQEQERRHLARELHDEIGQVLTCLKLSLQMGPHLEAGDVHARLGETREQIRELTARVRDLSLRLRPTMLDDLGLIPALLWHFERYTAQTQVQVRFEHRGLDRRFPQEVETAAYRIVQEALTNVARHARTDEAWVRIWHDHDLLSIQVEDPGTGFDTEHFLSSGTSSGLSGMHERAQLLGGRLTIESTRGAGTCVMAELPDQSTE